VIAEDGDTLVIDDNGVRLGGRVPAEYIYVHGTVGDVSHGTLGERRILGEEGVVATIVCVDLAKRDLVAGPEVATRGWVGAEDAPDLAKRVVERVRTNLVAALSEGKPLDVPAIEKIVRRAAGSTVNELTRRRPMIVPVVLEA
jgi:ribonuclease J